MDKTCEHVRKLPPLASSEDLSEDLLDSPEADARNKCLEDIVEVPNTPAKSPRQQTICLAMPNTPRIDISRASSSSHHDDSSPERDLFVDADGKSVESVKSGLGYTEEIIPDLHSSTEELNFHDLTESEIRRRRSKLQPQYAVSDATMDTDFAADRKDTASESGFLCISGRSSRVSSVGSVHSTASIASAASRLSAASNYSRASRGSSPHKVLLETSFCGPKSPEHFANRQLILNDDDDDLSEPTVRPKLADIETQTEQRPKKVHVDSVKKEIKNDQVKAKVKKTSKPKEVKPVKETKITKEIKEKKDVAMENKPKERKPKTKPASKVKVVLDNPKTQKFVPLESLDDDDVEIIQGNAPKQTPAAIPYETPSRPKKVTTGENQIYIPLNPDPNDPESGNPTSPKRLKPFTNPTLLNFINRDPATIESNRRIRRPVRSGSPGIREEFQKFIVSADEEADGIQTKPVKLRKQMSVEVTKRKSIDQDCSSRSMSPSIFEEFQKFITEPEDGDLNVAKLEAKNRCSTISITSREVQSVVGAGLTDSPQLGRSLSPSIHEEFQKFMAQPDDEEKGIVHKSLPPTAYKNPIEGSPSLSTSSNIRSISPSIYEEFQKFIVEPEGNDNLLPPPPPRKHENDLHPDEGPRSRSVSPGILDEFQKFISEPDDDSSGRKKCDPPPPMKSQQMIKVQVHCTPGSPPPEQVIIKNSGRPKSDDLVKIIPLKSEDDPNQQPTVSSSQAQILRRRSESSKEARPKTGTLEKSKDRRGSSRSLIGSLLQRASSFRSVSKKSPKRPSASEFVDIDPKFTNVEFKFNQDIQKDTVIIPLHSPNDSPEELVGSDSDTKITKAVVHVSYEPKPVEKSKTAELTENPSDYATIVSQTEEFKIETVTNAVSVVVNNPWNEIAVGKEKATAYDGNDEIGLKTSSDLVKFEDSLMSPHLSRSPDAVHSANSNDTSPDSDVMSSLTIVGTEEEKKKLFGQPESVEEELPHVPTTLPLERSVAVPIVPVKHRIADTKTCSLDRPPRCSTPNSNLPSGLGTYAVAAALEHPPVVVEKIQITLPKPKKTAVQTSRPLLTTSGDTAVPPCRRRRARSLNVPSSCPRGRWVDFEDDAAAAKPRSPKKITVLPSSLRPWRRSSSTADRRCGCDCHPHNHCSSDAWPAVTRNRSDTT